VVIPSWNGASILEPTLEHLRKLVGVEFEVLVVDHGRLNRDTESLLARLGDARLRYLGLDEQLGYAGAVAYGVKEARGPLVAVLCNDVLVEPGWLAELVEKFSEGPGKPVVTSLVTRPGFEPLRARLNLWGRIVRVRDTNEYSPFFPDGSAFLFDKSRFGVPFDADYFLYQEDVAIGWRAWLAGEAVVLAPRSRALNADGGTTRRMPYRSAFFTERNRWLNYLSFFSCSTLARALPLLLADACLRMLVGRNRFAKVHAWAWLLTHPRTVLGKRRLRQSERRRPDGEILPLISGNYLDEGHPFNGLSRAYCRLVGLRLG
jgi:GT2 family glycosyltransferase